MCAAQQPSQESVLQAMPFSELKELGKARGVPGKQRRTIIAQLLEAEQDDTTETASQLRYQLAPVTESQV